MSHSCDILLIKSTQKDLKYDTYNFASALIITDNFECQ